MNPRELNAIRRDIDRLRTAVAARPIKSAGGGGRQTTSPLWIIQTGKVLSGMGVEGIAVNSTTLTASDFPVPTGLPTPGTGETIDVPCLPLQSGLPLGVGIARNLYTNEFLYVINDASPVSYNRVDLHVGDQVTLTGATFTFDVASGGGFYRYTINRIDSFAYTS